MTTALEPAPGTGASSTGPASGRPLQVRGAGAAVVLAVVTYAAVATGLLPGAVTVLLALAALLLVPTATGASARVALNGSLVLGWTPVLWWAPQPFPRLVEVNHAAAVLALVVGGLGSVVLRSRQPGASLRALLPVGRRTDLVPVAAGVATLVAVHNLALAGSSRRALEILVPGADNYVHFHLFATLRLTGSSLDVATLPSDGSRWAQESYPTGFHTVVASVSELLHPGLAAGPDTVLAYAHALALTLVLAMVVVSAAIVSLPRVVDRPGVALPAVALVAAAFLWEPGQKNLANGFASFWLGALAVGTALVLSVHARRTRSVPHAAAIGGLAVLVAHTWTPLLVPMLPVGVLLLWDGDRDASPAQRAADRRRLLGCLVVLGLAGLGVLKAVLALFAHVDVTFLVTAFGGLNGTSPLPTFALVLAAFVVLPALPRSVRRGDPGDRALARRVRLLVLSPLAGVGLAVALLVAQMRTVGTTSYYFLKYLMGLELILAVLVAAVLALLVSMTTTRRTDRNAVALVVVVTVLATQFFGLVPGRTGLLLDDRDGGTAAVDGPYSRARLADGLVDAASRVTPARAIDLDYLALGDRTAAEAFYPDGWFHGLTGSLSADAMARVDLWRTKIVDPEDAVEPVTELLGGDATTRVVVAPGDVAALRAVLPEDLRARVVGWDCVTGSCPR